MTPYRTAATLLLAACALCAGRAGAEEPRLELDAARSRIAIDALPPDAPEAVQLASADIVSILWHRGERQRGSLPLIVLPGTRDPLVISLLGQPRSLVRGDGAMHAIDIDVHAYAAKAQWRPSASTLQRRAMVLLGAAVAITILLAACIRRRPAASVAGVCIAWSAALAFSTVRQPTLLTLDEPDSRWHLALHPQTLRVPILEGAPWLPVVESRSHLASLAPRVLVEGDRANLELTLARRAKVKLVRGRHE